MGYLTHGQRSATIIADDPVLLLGLNANVIKQTSLECQLRFNEAFIRSLIGRLANPKSAQPVTTKPTPVSADVA